MRALGALVATIAASGIAIVCACNLIVDAQINPKLGGTCEITGHDTTCGKCMASACQAKIDACCAVQNTNACPSLQAAESCATNTDNATGACPVFFAPNAMPYDGGEGASAPPPADEDLRICVRNACPLVCQSCAIDGVSTDGGATSACGACIAGKCSEQLLECCDPTVNQYVSVCAVNGNCAYLIAHSGDLPTGECPQFVAACVAKQCPGECFGAADAGADAGSAPDSAGD
jgi:hypothetical protein